MRTARRAQRHASQPRGRPLRAPCQDVVAPARQDRWSALRIAVRGVPGVFTGSCRPRRLACRSVAQHATGTVTQAPISPAPNRGSGEGRRCGWCRRVLPEQGSVGRPRLYCGQACRQRAYEQRSATAKAGLPATHGDVPVFLARGVQDRMIPKKTWEQTLKGLRLAGVEESSLLAKEYEGLGHEISGAVLGDLSKFLSRVVPDLGE